VGLWDSEEGLAQTFADVEELAAACRFRDCRHEGEPGCAIRAAVLDGDLEEERLAAWKKLRRELAFAERKRNHAAHQETKRRWKALTKEMRRHREWES